MPTPKTPNANRADNAGVTPSRDPDRDGDPRAHHQVGEASVHHRPDPRGLREGDPCRPYDRADDRRAQVRADVQTHLRRHQGR